MKIISLLVSVLLAQASSGQQVPLNKGWSLNMSGVSGGFYAISQTPQSVSFTFPDSSTGLFVDYLITKYRKSISGTITAQVQIVAPFSAIFIANPYPNACLETPAQVRLYFESGDNDGQRWWSNPQSVTLSNGIYTLAVPLTPDQWSGLNGESASQDAGTVANFQNAMRRTSTVGMTFGSCFFGHGVNASGGPAYFYLTSYVIQ